MDDEFIYLSFSKVVPVRELCHHYWVMTTEVLAGIICKRIGLKLLKINYTDSSGSCIDESAGYLPHGYFVSSPFAKTLLERKTSLPTFAAIWSPPLGGVKRESRSNRELSP